MKIEELTTATFHQKIADMDDDPKMWDYLSDRPCIVVFYLPCCSPCDSLMERLEELSVEYDTRFDIYKVNIKNEKRLAANFGVRTVPFLLFCPLTQEPQSAFGVMTKEELKNMIHRVLLRKPEDISKEEES